MGDCRGGGGETQVCVLNVKGIYLGFGPNGGSYLKRNYFFGKVFDPYLRLNVLNRRGKGGRTDGVPLESSWNSVRGFESI